MAMSKRKRVLLGICLGGLCLLTLATFISLSRISAIQTPPNGKLAARRGLWRLYYVPKSPNAMRDLKVWAAMYGGQDTKPSVGYGGPLAVITIADSGTVRTSSGEEFKTPAGHYRVAVQDTPMGWGTFWARLANTFR